MRGDGDDGQENADDADQNADGRLFGSAACSGVSSISVMSGDIYPRRGSCFDVAHFTACNRGSRARFPARPSDHLDDLAERGNIGNEFADLDLGAGELDDVARGLLG